MTRLPMKAIANLETWGLTESELGGLANEVVVRFTLAYPGYEAVVAYPPGERRRKLAALLRAKYQALKAALPPGSFEKLGTHYRPVGIRRRLPAQQLPTLLTRPGVEDSWIEEIEGLAPLRQALPAAEVLMLSIYTDAERVFEALRQGAIGYLEKTTPLPLLKEHLLQVAAGGSPMSPSVARHVTRYFAPRPVSPLASLTPREQDIVRGIEDGLSYKLIADRLGLSLDTVRSHIRQVYRKLQVNSKAEVISRGWARTHLAD